MSLLRIYSLLTVMGMSVTILITVANFPRFVDPFADVDPFSAGLMSPSLMAAYHREQAAERLVVRQIPADGSRLGVDVIDPNDRRTLIRSARGRHRRELMQHLDEHHEAELVEHAEKLVADAWARERRRREEAREADVEYYRHLIEMRNQLVDLIKSQTTTTNTTETAPPTDSTSPFTTEVIVMHVPRDPSDQTSHANLDPEVGSRATNATGNESRNRSATNGVDDVDATTADDVTGNGTTSTVSHETRAGRVARSENSEFDNVGGHELGNMADKSKRTVWGETAGNLPKTLGRQLFVDDPKTTFMYFFGIIVGTWVVCIFAGAYKAAMITGKVACYNVCGVCIICFKMWFCGYTMQEGFDDAARARAEPTRQVLGFAGYKATADDTLMIQQMNYGLRQEAQRYRGDMSSIFLYK